jgi:hypothetical protein
VDSIRVGWVGSVGSVSGWIGRVGGVSSGRACRVGWVGSCGLNLKDRVGSVESVRGGSVGSVESVRVGWVGSVSVGSAVLNV